MSGNNTDVDKILVFTLLGYQMLSSNDSKGEPYRWRHVVITGFNKAFREFFPGLDPREELHQLEKLDLIKVQLAKFGATFKPEPAAFRALTAAEKAFAAEVRTFLEGFIRARAEAAAAKLQRKAGQNGAANVQSALPAKKPPSRKEQQAAELASAGKFDEAMKLLGYA